MLIDSGIYLKLEVTVFEYVQALLSLKFKKSEKENDRFVFYKHPKSNSFLRIPKWVSESDLVPKSTMLIEANIMFAMGIISDADDLAKIIQQQRLARAVQAQG